MKTSAGLTIVGGGLAGSLLAIFLARRGFKVEVFERRPDPRRGQVERGRSINLALSTRGIHALEKVGAANAALKRAIPMRGRMIHPVAGEPSLIPYGISAGHVINSVSRAGLNEVLLSLAESNPNVKVHFDSRCVGMDLQTGALKIRNEVSGITATVAAEVVIGTDGAASALRMEMIPSGRFDFSQAYLGHSYKELNIPPSEAGSFRMEPNALHIWPRGGFMMIALPNPDASFTCTLFYNHDGPGSFADLKSESAVRKFFDANFPDAVPILPGLEQQFFSNPTGTLMTIKCYPWNFGSRLLLLGDAAHAIVPFYGQGMNCAFEDCVILDDCIEKHGEDWEQVFIEFGRRRKPDADAIADLALDNFVEMRDTSGNAKFALKKKLEHLLEEKYPQEFISKYGMVTFTRTPYRDAMKIGRAQDELLMGVVDRIDHLDEINAEDVMNRIREEIQPAHASVRAQ